ncbi:hypothetical protein KR032_009177 [Drosophila birchii]|nr:hypothetical protein KR032_009177 [Drosophila birchii]
MLASLAVSSLAAPFDFGDIFSSFQPLEKQDVVKRQVQVQGNPDAELKQISFHGLIGDLEDSLFQSALSLHQASAPGSEVEEVKPGQVVEEDEEHALTKRSDESTPATTDTEGSTDDGLARKILVQTTKKVPGSEDGVPAHLIIDHVSVQPHNGGALPLIPTFQVHHTKLISATIKEDSNSDSSDGKQTKISITKTSITSTAPLESVEEAVAAAAGASSSSSSPSTTTESATTKAAQEKEQTEADKPSSTTVLTIVTSSSSSSSSTSTPTSTTTTEAPIEKLKKDEEKLKEKVAEVEADPIILSARV